MRVLSICSSHIKPPPPTKDKSKMDMEDIKDFDDEKLESRKRINVYVFGLVIVIAVVLGTIQSVDYVLKLTAPEDLREITSFLVLKRQETGSVLYSHSSSGIETQIYRDTAEILNPTVFYTEAGAGFAFCKRAEGGETEIYTKIFKSEGQPVKVPNISPRNCLYSISSDTMGTMISYISDSDGISISTEIYQCKLDGSLPTKEVSELNEASEIVSCPVNIGFTGYSYVLRSDDKYKLKFGDNVRQEYISPIDFIASGITRNVVVLEKDSDTIEIFENYSSSSPKTFTTEKATIKKLMFARWDRSIYCLICSKKNPKRCKVIEVSLLGSEAEKTREVIKKIDPVADIVLMP